MTCHYPDLGSASDWLKQIPREESVSERRSSVFLCYAGYFRYDQRIYALVCQSSFRGETSGCVAKCRLFSEASSVIASLKVLFCWRSLNNYISSIDVNAIATLYSINNTTAKVKYPDRNVSLIILVFLWFLMMSLNVRIFVLRFIFPFAIEYGNL